MAQSVGGASQDTGEERPKQALRTREGLATGDGRRGGDSKSKDSEEAHCGGVRARGGEEGLEGVALRKAKGEESNSGMSCYGRGASARGFYARMEEEKPGWCDQLDVLCGTRWGLGDEQTTRQNEPSRRLAAAQTGHARRPGRPFLSAITHNPHEVKAGEGRVRDGPRLPRVSARDGMRAYEEQKRATVERDNGRAERSTKGALARISCAETR